MGYIPASYWEGWERNRNRVSTLRERFLTEGPDSAPSLIQHHFYEWLVQSEHMPEILHLIDLDLMQKRKREDEEEDREEEERKMEAKRAGFR